MFRTCTAFRFIFMSQRHPPLAASGAHENRNSAAFCGGVSDALGASERSLLPCPSLASSLAAHPPPAVCVCSTPALLAAARQSIRLRGGCQRARKFAGSASQPEIGLITRTRAPIRTHARAYLPQSGSAARGVGARLQFAVGRQQRFRWRKEKSGMVKGWVCCCCYCHAETAGVVWFYTRACRSCG